MRNPGRWSVLDSLDWLKASGLRIPGIAEPWASPVAVAVTALAIWLCYELVYALGGTKLAYAHLGYLPTLIGAALLGVPGGLVAGLVTGFAFGPLMPLDALTGAPQPPESWTLRAAFFAAFGGGVGLLVTLGRRRIARLNRDALLFPQTGLPNRNALMLHIQRGNGPGCLLVVDAQRYEQTAVTLGAEATDIISATLSERLRRLSSSKTRLFQLRSARFALWLPEAEPVEAMATARTLATVLNEPITVADINVLLEPVIGIARTVANETPGRILHYASIAVSKAIQTRQPLALYEAADYEDRRQALRLLADFRHALDTAAEFDLHYQPKIELATGRCIGAEGLFRWTHPERGPVSPGLLMPLVEETTMIGELSRWVLQRAARDLATPELPADFVIAVNISVRDLEEAAFRHLLIDTVRHGAATGRRLEVEVTETMLIRDFADARAALDNLRENGVRIAIDDFGTGYASFNYLRDLPADTLKLDRDFIRHLPNHDDEVIVRLGISLGQQTGKIVVAEGVESLEVGRQLAEWGCHQAQGYAFAPPMPLDALVEFLAEWPKRGLWLDGSARP